MKVVILAGGLGSRLSEETTLKPKPMIEIGGKPILWHIMKIYSYHGFRDFIICLGYKGYCIKEWVSNLYLHHSDVTFDLKQNKIEYHYTRLEDWRITLVDTGENTMTGGRIKRIQPYVGNETFMATYGDGVGNIDIIALIAQHRKHGKIGTLTATIPEGRFGVLNIGDQACITSFAEKKDNTSRVNAGFFVFEPGIFEYISGDDTILEQEPLERLAQDRQLYAYPHDGFWKPMDKLSDRQELERLWQTDQASWKLWN